MSSLALQVSERERRGVGVSTVERILRAGATEVDVRTETDSVGGHLVRVQRQRVSQAPLDRLNSKGHITAEQFEAGDMLRTDYLRSIVSGTNPLAQEGGARAVSSDPAIGRMIRAAAAGMAFREAAEALSGTVREVVLLVCLGEAGLTMAEIGRALGYTDRRSAEVAAMSVARVGLDQLAKWYGV